MAATRVKGTYPRKYVDVSGGGGGTMNHAALTSNLAWSTSAHTGTASRFAVFDGAGAAAYLAYPTTGLTTWTGTAFGNATISAPLTYSAGTLAVTQSDATHNGYLSSADWSTFNAKVSASRTISTTAPLTGGGDLSANRTIAITLADATHDGYLSSTDWNTFNGKEPAISAGTASQYWRGDKSWQTLDKAAVGLGNVENTALSTWAGSTNVTTLGTVATGTWNAAAIGPTYGGTGQTTYTTGDLIYASAPNTLSKLAIGGSAYFLGSNGTTPGWRQPSDVRSDLGLVIGTNVQAYDAGLQSLTSADASAGLPYVSGANTWATATYTAMLSVVSGAWKVIGWRESGGTDLTNGAIADGQLMARVGTAVAGVNVSSTPTASYVVKSDGSGKVDGWVSAASTSVPGLAQFAVDGGITALTALQASDSRLNKLLASLASLIGAGSLGSPTFDGAGSVTGWTRSGSTYTATTAAYYDYATITIAAGVTLKPVGVVLRWQSLVCTGTGTCTIDTSGGDGSGTTAGAAQTFLATAPLLGGTTGGVGRVTTGTGPNGVNTTSGVNLGPVGGTGGNGNGNVGGSGGSESRTYTYPSVYGDLVQLLRNLYATAVGSSPTLYCLAGGTGGGGGGASIGGNGTSGAGGGGGGALAVFGGSVNTGTCTLALIASGGRGADATTGSGAGNNSVAGGGGGSAGGILAFFGYVSGTVTLTASGGRGGDGKVYLAGTNVSGSNGGSGGFIGCVYGGGTAPTATAAAGAAGAAAGGGAAGSAGSAGSTYVMLAT